MPQLGSESHGHRGRVLHGMAHAVSSKGYGDTTIGDIVREASVSRRTFYEHFSCKADCLVSLYEAASRRSLEAMREAIDPSLEWQAQIDRALVAYLGCMARSPVLVRTLFIEILHLGAEGLEARRRVNVELADFILQVVNARGAHGRKLTKPLAMAIVGGINELILEYIEQDKVTQLTKLVPQASELVRLVTASQ